jgi:hypothetical protein
MKTISQYGSDDVWEWYPPARWIMYLPKNVPYARFLWTRESVAMWRFTGLLIHLKLCNGRRQ